MIRITSTCDRCHKESNTEAKDLASATNPLNVLSAGGNTGNVCGKCLEYFMSLKKQAEDYRAKLYSDFWLV